MTVPSKVRIAGPADYQECWRLFLQLHNENGVFKLAPEKVNWVLVRLLDPSSIPPNDTGMRGAVGVIGPVGALEGIAVLTISSYWYSNEMHLEEFAVFVDPEHRKSNHAQSLIQWMKDQVEITKLPLVTGIISNTRTEAKCRLYRRMLPKIGEFFLYNGLKGSDLTPALAARSS